MKEAGLLFFYLVCISFFWDMPTTPPIALDIPSGYARQATAPATSQKWIRTDITDGTGTVEEVYEWNGSAWAKIDEWYDNIGDNVSLHPPIYIANSGQSNSIPRNSGGDITTTSWAAVWDATTTAWVTLDPNLASLNPHVDCSPNCNWHILHFCKEAAKRGYITRVVHHGQGSQYIEAWTDPTKPMWDEWESRMDASGVTEFDVVFWLQGEANRDDSHSWYENRLVNVLYQTQLLAKSYITPNTLFLAIEIPGVRTYTDPPGNDVNYQNVVINGLAADAVTPTNWIHGTGLPLVDEVHPTGLGFQELGVRMWDAYQTIISPTPPLPKPPNLYDSLAYVSTYNRDGSNTTYQVDFLIDELRQATSTLDAIEMITIGSPRRNATFTLSDIRDFHTVGIPNLTNYYIASQNYDGGNVAISVDSIELNIDPPAGPEYKALYGDFVGYGNAQCNDVFIDAVTPTFTDLSGVSVSNGNDLTFTTSSVWAGTAATNECVCDGQDGYIEFKMNLANSTTKRMAGLSYEPLTNNSFSSLDYAAHLDNSSILRLYELGSLVHNSGTTISATDVIRIEATGSVVEYKLNGTVIYTSATARQTN